MFFFQPQQHSHSHLILSHISYYEERRGTHEKEKRTFRQNKLDATAEQFSFRCRNIFQTSSFTIPAISYLKSGMYTDSSAQSAHPAGRNCVSALNETHSKILPGCCT